MGAKEKLDQVNKRIKDEIKMEIVKKELKEIRIKDNTTVGMNGPNWNKLMAITLQNLFKSWDILLFIAYIFIKS